MIDKLCIMVFLLGIANQTLSQTVNSNTGFMQGYIVKINNDTLYGEVKIRQDNDRMLENIRYRKSPDSKIEYYFAISLKAFQMGSYSYIVVGGDYYQQFIKDKVSVYERREHKYVTPTGPNSTMRVWSDEEKSFILLIREDGRTLRYENNQKLIRKSLKKKLSKFFFDKATLIAKINQSHYTNSDIIYMTYEFNDPAKYQVNVINKKQYKQEKAARKREL